MECTVSRRAATAYSLGRKPEEFGSTRIRKPRRATPLTILVSGLCPETPCLGGSASRLSGRGRASNTVRSRAEPRNEAAKILNGVARRGFVVSIPGEPLADARGYMLSPLRG